MKAQKRVFLFIASAVGLYVVWYILYDFWILPHTRLDPWLNTVTTQTGAGLLRLFGFDVAAKEGVMQLKNHSFLKVGNQCNGLEFFALFSGFVLLFPGPWKLKAIYIPAGVLIIFLLNVVRVAILAINYHFSRHTFDFNHKYTFSFFVYGAIFWMWMLWVNKFSGLKELVTLKKHEQRV